MRNQATKLAADPCMYCSVLKVLDYGRSKPSKYTTTTPKMRKERKYVGYNRIPVVLSQSQQHQRDKGLIFNVSNTWRV